MHFKEESDYTPKECKTAFPEQKKKGLHHTVRMGRGDWQDAHAWCRANTTDYSWNGSYFHFRTENEAIQFRLIWG